MLRRPPTLLAFLAFLTISLSAPTPSPRGIEPVTGAFAGTQAANGAVSVAKGASSSIVCDIYNNRVNKGLLNCMIASNAYAYVTGCQACWGPNGKTPDWKMQSGCMAGVGWGCPGGGLEDRCA